MMNSTAVEVNDLTVRRGGKSVLAGLNLSLPAGQITGLLGPSGSGKSTLIRAIVGVQQVTSGQVTVLGEAAGSPSLRRRVAYLTQSPSVYDDLSVAANVHYFGALSGFDRAAAQRAIDQVGLAAASRQLVGTLSGGQRARVGLASALVVQPELLVMDEPTVGLDPVLRRDLWQLFAELAARGTTLLVSSHVLDEAVNCDQLVLLRQGQVLAQASPTQLLESTGASDAEGAFLALIEADTRPVPHHTSEA